VLHAERSLQALEFRLEGHAEATRTLTYAHAGSFLALPAGTYRVAVREPGATRDLAASSPLSLATNGALTLVFTGRASEGDSAPRFVIVPDSSTGEEPAGVTARVLNATENSSSVVIDIDADDAEHPEVSLADFDALSQGVTLGARTPLLLATVTERGTALLALGIPPADDEWLLVVNGRDGVPGATGISVIALNRRNEVLRVLPQARLHFLQLATGGGRDVFAAWRSNRAGESWAEFADDLRFAEAATLSVPQGSIELRQYATIPGSAVWPQAAADGLRQAQRAEGSATFTTRSARDYLVWLKAARRDSATLEVFEPRLPEPPAGAEGELQDAVLQVLNGSDDVGSVRVSSDKTSGDPVLTQGVTYAEPIRIRANVTRLLLFRDQAGKELLRSFTFTPVPGHRILAVIGGSAVRQPSSQVSWTRDDDADRDGYLFPSDAEPAKVSNYAPFDLRLLIEELGAVEQDDCPEQSGSSQGCPDPELGAVAFELSESSWQSSSLAPSRCTASALLKGGALGTLLKSIYGLRASVAVACSEIAQATDYGDRIDDASAVTDAALTVCSAASAGLAALRSQQPALSISAKLGACVSAGEDCSTLCKTDAVCAGLCAWRAPLQATCESASVTVQGSGSAVLDARLASALERVFSARARLAVLPAALDVPARSLASQLLHPGSCGVASQLELAALGYQGQIGATSINARIVEEVAAVGKTRTLLTSVVSQFSNGVL
jgi:hypothetical protein